jgi:hypothetical protein
VVVENPSFYSAFHSGDLKIFSGGMPRASHGDKNTVTLVQNSKTIALDFTSKVVDFLTIPNAGESFLNQVSQSQSVALDFKVATSGGDVTHLSFAVPK